MITSPIADRTLVSVYKMHKIGIVWLMTSVTVFMQELNTSMFLQAIYQ